VGIHALTLSYTPRSMKCDFQASLLGCTFASPCFGHEPKARVATNPMPLCFLLVFPTRNNTFPFFTTFIFHLKNPKKMQWKIILAKFQQKV
jgi:hypothetical protein